MAEVIKTFPGDDACKVPLTFTAQTATGLPMGFSCYGEWERVGDDETFTLKSDETQRQLIQGKTVYLVVKVPDDAPLGLYVPSLFEMRVGQGDNQKTKAIDLRRYSAPEIDVEAREEKGIDWPTLAS